jgi:capsular exopolysaccharide synthesis family protein
MIHFGLESVVLHGMSESHDSAKEPKLEEYEDELSLAELFRILLRRIHWVIGVFLIVSIAAVVYVIVKPDMYEATTRIEVQTLSSMENPQQRSAGGTLSLELEYLKNSQTLKRALDSLDLNGYEIEELSQKYRSERDYRQLAERIEVSHIEDTRLVDISFSSVDPKFSRDFVEALTASFELSLLDVVRTGKLNELEGYELELSDVQRRYDEVHQRLEDFRLEHDLAQKRASESLWNRSIPYINTKMEAIESSLRTESPSSVAATLKETETLGAQLEEYVSAFRRLTYMEIQRLNDPSASNRDGSDAASVAVLEELEAKQAVDELAASISEAWNELSPSAQSIGAQDGLQALKWSVLNELRTQYIDNLNELADLKAEESIMVSERSRYQGQMHAVFRNIEAVNIQVSSLNTAVSTVTPLSVEEGASDSTSPMLILAVGLLLGLFLGVLSAFLVDMVTPTIDHPDILMRTLGNGVRQLGTVPLWKKDGSPDASLVTLKKDADGIVETYNLVAGSLLFTGESEQGRCFSITSAGPSEGSTFTAANLGAVMAQSGKRVLLIDASGSWDSLSSCFSGVRTEQGLSEVIEGSTSWEKAVFQPYKELGSLHVMPFGKGLKRRSAVVHHAQFKQTIVQLREHFDVVLIDSPSFSSPSDQLAVAQAVEGVVLIVRSGITQRSQVKYFTGKLADTGVPLFGIVYNGYYPQRLSAHHARVHGSQHVAGRAEYRKKLHVAAASAKRRRAAVSQQIA